MNPAFDIRATLSSVMRMLKMIYNLDTYQMEDQIINNSVYLICLICKFFEDSII